MENSMENSPLMEMITEQLRDLYDAEKQLTRALPKLAKAATDEELSQAFRNHAEETQGQVQRLEQIFETLGMKNRGKPCAAMKGLVEEANEAIQEMDDPILDLALIASARRVEHYEMAAYETLIAGAQASKQTDAVNLLKETLREENEADKKVATIAKRLLKEVARGLPAEEADGGEEEQGGGSRGRSSGRGGKSGSGQSRGGSRSGSNGDSGGGSRGSARASSANSSQTTTDHDEIRQWAEERGGRPACVMGTGAKGDIGMLRIEFPGKPNAKDDKLTEISWEDFFEKFDERGLALVYQGRTARGQTSNFNKLISRETESRGKSRAAR
jgi:ferritin-like metal-binding protein YciE